MHLDGFKCFSSLLLTQIIFTAASATVTAVVGHLSGQCTVVAEYDVKQLV